MKILFVLLIIPFLGWSQTHTLQIEEFKTGAVGVVRAQSTWDIDKEIVLPIPPVYISITLSGTEGKDLVCFLTSDLTAFDTLHLGASPSINLFNLPGGEYVAIFVDRNTNERVSKAFKIESEFWGRWWFPPVMLFAFSFFIAMIFYIIYKIRLRQQLQNHQVRDSIARDLHDDIGSYLSSISILSQNVGALLSKDPEKASLSSKRIGETARLVMDTMGDIVWSINPSHDSMPLIIQKMQDLAAELFYDQDIRTSFVADDSLDKLNLSLDRRRDFYLIFKEAITNIKKYALATEVQIKITKVGQQIELSIKDNGVGFDISAPTSKKANGGNGLENMRTRAERLGGQLQIESDKGKGTLVHLYFLV